MKGTEELGDSLERKLVYAEYGTMEEVFAAEVQMYINI
jgi:hypothetical protein